MKLIVGLGNPGKQYENTRHNVGFMLVDVLVHRMEDDQWKMDKKSNSLIVNHHQSVFFVKPQTFMNDSGQAVQTIASFYKIVPSAIWIMHDDLDIRLGDYKIERGHGPKLHNGISSIEEKLGSKDFWRVRVGVDNREPDNRISGETYVLQDFTADEKVVINGVFEKVMAEFIPVVKSK